MLQTGAAVTAGGASEVPARNVARRVRAPSDREGRERQRAGAPACIAVRPHPGAAHRFGAAPAWRSQVVGLRNQPQKGAPALVSYPLHVPVRRRMAPAPSSPKQKRESVPGSGTSAAAPETHRLSTIKPLAEFAVYPAGRLNTGPLPGK